MLFRKMIRDFKQHKLQFLSVFLLAFIAVYAYAGITSEITGVTETKDSYFEESNMADVWIYADNIDNDTKEKIDNISSTKQSARQLVIESTGDMKDNPTITLHFLEENLISKFHLSEGEDINLSDKDGIWIDKSFADKRNLSVGDNITVKANGMEFTKTIRGMGYSPEYIYPKSESLTPDYYQQGFAYLSYEAFPFDNIIYNTLLIKTDANTSTYENNVNDAIGKENYSTFLSLNDSYSYSQLNAEMQQHEMFAAVIPIVFVFVAILVLLTTMNRIIANQRTQIGTLKALGFSTRKIIIHYLSFGFYLTLLGAIVGLIAGPITITPIFFESLSPYYCMPVWKAGFNNTSLIIAAITILSTLFVLYFSIRQLALEEPAVTLNPKVPKVSKAGWFEKTHLWEKLGFNLKWNFRDIKRNKLRAFVSIIGVIGCVTLLVTAFAMDDIMDDFVNWEYGEINHYDTKLSLEENITNEQVEKIVNETGGTQIMEGSIEIQANDIKKTASITSYNHTSMITPTDDHYNKIELPENGVALSIKMAEILGVDVGDEIEWHMYGSNKWVKTKVDALYADPAFQGIVVTPTHLEDLDLNFTPTSVVTNHTVNENYTGVSSKLSTDQLLDSFGDLMETADLMVYVLIILGSASSIIILYDLGLLSYTENERDMATLKVLGMKTSSLRKLLLTPNILYGLIGFIPGIIGSYIIILFSLASAGDSYYYIINITPRNLIITFVFTMALSILVSVLLSRKLKDVDMVESLKSNE